MCFKRKSKMKSDGPKVKEDVKSGKSPSSSVVTRKEETSGSIGTHVLSKNVVFRSTYFREEQKQSTSASVEFKEKIRDMQRQRQERFRSPSLELPNSKPGKKPSMFSFRPLSTTTTSTSTSISSSRPGSYSHLASSNEPLRSTTRPVSIDVPPVTPFRPSLPKPAITTTITPSGTVCDKREKENSYRLKSNPRGFCLIIANTNFRMASQLPGNTQDATRISDVFRSYGFVVRKYENQTANEMRSIFQKYSTASELRSQDALIVFISTHGNHLNGKELFLGSDDDYIFREDILSYFNNRNCPNLIGKPKIFLIDACRGGAEDVGIPIQRNAPPIVQPFAAKLAKKVPEWSDMLIYSSSVVGYVSWGTKTGSFFTMALVDLLKEHGKTHDLITILEKVTLKVVEAEANSKLQAPSEEKRGWTKKLYF